MELFVYLRTGGKPENMTVQFLNDDAAGLCAKLAEFDANSSYCSEEIDRDKLLAAIETSFGTATPFNELVRNMFAETVRAR